MITGLVTNEGVPLLSLPVAGQSWPAILDTGFNGDLELPDALRSAVNARFQGRVLSILAGEQQIEEDSYYVDFPFDGSTISADATFVASGEILIGTHLLRDYRLEIDFPGRSVRLERVPWANQRERICFWQFENRCVPFVPSRVDRFIDWFGIRHGVKSDLYIFAFGRGIRDRQAVFAQPLQVQRDRFGDQFLDLCGSFSHGHAAG